MFLVAPIEARADAWNGDITWTANGYYDIIPNGVWARQSLADNLWRISGYGFNANFAWYCGEQTIIVQPGDQREMASWNQLMSYTGRWYGDRYFTRLKNEYYSGASFRTWKYGESFVAKVCGNHTPFATNPLPPRISGYKWNDLDGDGAWDSGEPAMNGWKINFYRYGTYMGSTTTNVNGYYEFVIDATAGRLPGSWSMTEDVKPGWYQTRAPGGVWVNEGVPDVNYANNNFGNFRYGTISGAKWNDTNANGQKDAGEPGLGGWSIRLMKGGVVSQSAGTGADGSYSFNNLSVGTYVVQEIQQSGWRQTAPSGNTYTVTVTSGGSYGGRDFGNVQDGSIKPYKVHDLNMDGAWNQPGELLLADWVIHLGSDFRAPLTTTDSMATTPEWEQLPSGTYEVWEELQPHFAPTAEPTQTVVLGPGQHISVPFFNVALGRIDVVKYHDLDGDGSQGANEPAVPDWSISLSQDGSVVGNGTTAADGAVAFEDLMPGVYTVSEESRPPYWKSTTSETREVVLGPGQDVDVFFGNRLLGDIEGYKFEDLNGNQHRDPGEPPVKDVHVALTNPDGNSVGVPTSTDADGRYYFPGVVPGDYVVSETVPEGWLASSATSGAVAVVGGRVNHGPEFLNVEGISVSGAKFDDSNADGARSAEETGLPGWEISLERKVGDAWTVEAKALTQADGSYSFDMLRPGEYRLAEAMKPHWKQTVAPASCGVLASGVNASGNDFGNLQLSELTLSKWDDSNSNGVRDGGERALPGWEFEVVGTAVDGSTYTHTAVAGSDGSVVLEDLMPGNYSAAEQHIGRVLNPDGTVAEPGWRPATDDSANVSLGEGDAKATSFGNIHLGWIWGRVTHELYGNGISGIRIDLEETGDSCYTNPEGYYYFYDIEPNETSACPTPDYLVGMDLTGTTWTTHSTVDQSVKVPEGGQGRADFTVYEDTYGNQPRTIGYWKNWKNHYTRDEMQALVDKVRLGSGELSNLTVDDVYTFIQVDKSTSMRAKARAQYVAFWLNVVSGNLGLSTTVNVSSVSGWQQVVGSATTVGVVTVIDLIHDAEQAFTQQWVPAAWETIKNIFDKLNNGLLT